MTRLLLLLLVTLAMQAVAAIPSQAEPSTPLQVKPRLCIQHAGEPCVLTLTASWHSATPLCLYQQYQPDTAIVCQADANLLQLTLPITRDTRLLLKDPHTGVVVAQRQLKLLQVDLKSGEQLLNKSRNGWWALP